MPLRPIVSGNGSVTESVAKHLSKFLNKVKVIVVSVDRLIKRSKNLQLKLDILAKSFE